MELLTFSDMKLVQPTKYDGKKINYKQIGFFDDKILNKNIGSLKTNLDKKESFLKTYSNAFPKSNNIYYSYSERKIYAPSKDQAIEACREMELENSDEINANKINENLSDQAHSNSKANLLVEKIETANIKQVNRLMKATKNSSTGTDDNHLNADKRNKAGKITNKNIVFHQNENKPGENIRQKSLDIKNNEVTNDITNRKKSHLLKNKIISGHVNVNINKEIESDLKCSEVSSIRNTLYSNFNKFTAKNMEENDNKSELTRREMNNKNNNSTEVGQDSFRITHKESLLNKKFMSPFSSHLGSKDSISSKIDFVYKKIFDKKSRHLFEKAQLEKKIIETTNKNHRTSLSLNKKAPEINRNSIYPNIEFFKKKQYIEDKIQDIKRKIFFIKGVYDYSYPKIIVNKVKTAQDYYNLHHTEQKLKLRDSMNATASKVFEDFTETHKLTNDNFNKSFYVQNFSSSTHVKNKTSDQNDNFIHSHTSLNFKPLKISKLTLTTKFTNLNELSPIKVVNPLSIKAFNPDMRKPSNMKHCT